MRSQILYVLKGAAKDSLYLLLLSAIMLAAYMLANGNIIPADDNGFSAYIMALPLSMYWLAIACWLGLYIIIEKVGRYRLERYLILAAYKMLGGDRFFNKRPPRWQRIQARHGFN